MSSDELRSQIESGFEDRRREFKRSGTWDEHRAKIVKAALAMANTPQGGLIIIGVEESEGRCQAVGMREEDFATYDPDAVIEAINRYADPPVACRLHKVELGERRFAVVEVDEFAELPVIAKRDLDGHVVAAQIYARSSHRIESHAVRSQTEMREIIDLATAKGMRRFLAQAAAAGVSTGAKETPVRRQIKAVKDRLPESRAFKEGYMLCCFWPGSVPSPAMNSLEVLRRLAQGCETRYMGWRMPAASSADQVSENEAIGSPRSAAGASELWRLHCSGLFVQALALSRLGPQSGDPWAHVDYYARQNARHGFTPAGAIRLIDPVCFVTLLYEYAAKMVVAAPWSEDVHVQVELVGAKDWVLVPESGRRFMPDLWAAGSDILVESTHPAEDVAGKPRHLASGLCMRVLERFARNSTHALSRAYKNLV